MEIFPDNELASFRFDGVSLPLVLGSPFVRDSLEGRCLIAESARENDPAQGVALPSWEKDEKAKLLGTQLAVEAWRTNKHAWGGRCGAVDDIWKKPGSSGVRKTVRNCWVS